MLLARHVHYTDHPIICERIEITFDPPIDLASPLGKIGSLYGDAIPKLGTARRRVCRPVVNQNGILHVTEVMKAGELLTIRVRPGSRLQNLVLRDAHELQVVPDAKRLQYWFTAGIEGAIEITGELVDDTDGMFGRLKSNLKDIPYRAFAVQRSIAGMKASADAIDKPKDIMNTREAAAYLGRSASWLYKKAQSQQIPRTPHGKYCKSDLDKYLVTTPDGAPKRIKAR